MAEQVFVARERELSQLQTFFDRALAGQGTVCFVTGEAGAGKTALVHEFARRAQDTHADLLVAIGDCNAQTGIGDPYLPFREVLGLLTGDVEAKLAQGAITPENAGRLRDFVRVSGQALVEYGPDLIDIFVPGGALATRVAGKLAQRAGWVERLEMLVQHKAHAAAGQDTHLEQSHIFEQYTRVLQALAAQRPLIIVVDDLQWADTASIGLLFHLGRRIQESRILLVGAYRPADVALGRPSIGAGQTDRHPLEPVLNELKRYYADVWVNVGQEGEATGRSFIDALLDTEPNRLGEAFRQALLQHTGGHPLFTIELLRSLQERGDLVKDEAGRWVEGPMLDWGALPARVEGVIAERIGRLEEELRYSLTIASVQGEDFTAQVIARLQAVDERHLVRRLTQELDKQHRLVREEGIERLGRQRLSLFRFRHNLFQRYLYNHLGQTEREFLHEDVGNVLEELYGDQASEVAVQLARHFQEAGLDDKALPYLVEAGDRALRTYATAEASAFYTRALEVLQTVEDLPSARQAYEGRGRMLMLTNDPQRAAENYHEMLHYAEAHGDTPMQISALNKLSSAVILLGQFEAAEKHLTGSEQLAREHTDLPGLAELYWVRCNICNMIADFSNAVKYLRESVQIARQLNLKEQLAYGLTHIANTLTFLTRFDEAWQTAQEGLQVSEEIGHYEHEAECLAFSIPAYHLRNGDLDAARQTAEAGVDIATKIGTAFPECIGALTLGNIAQARGEYEAAIVNYQRALKAGRAMGHPMMEAIPLGALGSVYLEISHAFVDQVMDYHNQALALMEHPVGKPAGGAAWADLGFCFLAKDDLDRADKFFQKGMTVPTMLGQLNRPRFLVGSTFVALARNQLDDAAKWVNEARPFVEERAMKNLYPLVALAGAQVSAARGEADRALEQFERAESLALEMGMRPLVWQARAHAAKVLAGLGRLAEAEMKHQAARATIDEIGGLFEDEKLRRLFVESAMRKLEGMAP